MKTWTRAICAMALASLLLSTTSATHSSDGDPISDAAESLGVPCANTLTQDLFNQVLSGLAGWCNNATDYESSLFNPAPCSACNTTIVPQLTFTDREITPRHDPPPITVVPEVDQVITTLNLSYGSGSTYCVELDGLGFQCVNTDPLPPNTLPVGEIPIVYIENRTHDQGPVENTSFDLEVSYRSIETLLDQRVGPGSFVNYYLPVDPSAPGDVVWWLENGNQTSLDFAFTFKQNGTAVEDLTLSVPYVGQILRAQERSLDETVP